MPIIAAQLLYANVEKDRSPHQRSGFQTLFYSQSRLSEAEVDAIEPRLFYAHGAGNPPKGLFFPLGQDKLVLARIVPLEDTDAFGRKGRYLAHALVFDRTDWIAEGLNPIALLQSFPFLTSLDQALAAGDRGQRRYCAAYSDLGSDERPSQTMARSSHAAPDPLRAARRDDGWRTPSAGVYRPARRGRAGARRGADGSAGGSEPRVQLRQLFP